MGRPRGARNCVTFRPLLSPPKCPPNRKSAFATRLSSSKSNRKCSALMADEHFHHIRIDQRHDGDDDAGPEGDFEDLDAVGDFLVAPLGQAAVDLVELAVD